MQWSFKVQATNKQSMSEIEYLKQLGSAIRTVRKSKKISIARLAEIANMDYSFLGYLERGKRNASILTLYKIAEALKVDIKTIL